MAGFHIGVRGKAAGQVVRCTAREGACKLTGADGEPTPHFASLADGEAFLAEQENADKGGFTPAASSNADVTGGDTGASDASADDETADINYDKIAADAADIHDRAFESLENVIHASEIISANRSWFAERIVGPNGYIAVPENVDSDTRNKLLKQAADYFDAANEAEDYLVASGTTLQGSIANSAALALTAEVHRLTHQEGEVGDLLRDLQSKGQLEAIVNLDNDEHPFWLTGSSGIGFGIDEEKEALVDQATAELHEAMKPYRSGTAAATLARFFKQETDESGRLLYSCYFLNTSEFRPVREVEVSNNMQRFTSAILADLSDPIDEYRQAEKNLLETVESLQADGYLSAREHSQE